RGDPEDVTDMPHPSIHTGGQTLTRPFHARPRKCHLAGVNDYHSNGTVTCSQREPRSLHLALPCFHQLQ
ncbi:hypothetical protein JOQ06_018501, partial [Pogonophryne albipinna]